MRQGALDKFAIAEALREIADLNRFLGEPIHRIKAYERGARAIEAVQDLDRLVAERRLTDIPGIGDTLARLVTELYVNGEASMLEQLRARAPGGMLALARVPGVTPRIARMLSTELGISTVDELREAALAGRVQALKGFGARKEAKLLEGIEALERRGQEVTWTQADAVAAPLAEWLLGDPAIRQVEPAGPLRRAVETVEAVDLVAVAADPDTVRARLEAYPQVAHFAEVEAGLWAARLGDGVMVRVSATTAKELPTRWLERTAGEMHLARLRELAAERGLRLDPTGLYHGKKRVAAADEAALYQALGLPFIPAEMRDDASAIDAGLAGDDLADVLRIEDIRGMTHCHTVYSDGKNTVAEMAEAADAMGMEYMTITDHSPAAHYAGGVTLDRLKQQWDEIARVQETVKVKLLRGTESDILADGALDYPDAVLEMFDVIIASIHSRMKMDAAEMTRRIESCMRLPVFKIWGHPLGRMLLVREPVACDVDRILDAMAESRCAVEINGDPRRLDLPPHLIPAARARGLRFVVSTDAHSVRALGNLRFGVATARRGGLRRGEVLNTLDADRFREAVRPAL